MPMQWIRFIAWFKPYTQSPTYSTYTLHFMCNCVHWLEQTSCWFQFWNIDRSPIHFPIHCEYPVTNRTKHFTLTYKQLEETLYKNRCASNMQFSFEWCSTYIKFSQNPLKVKSKTNEMNCLALDFRFKIFTFSLPSFVVFASSTAEINCTVEFP